MTLEIGEKGVENLENHGYAAVWDDQANEARLLQLREENSE